MYNSQLIDMIITIVWENIGMDFAGFLYTWENKILTLKLYAAFVERVDLFF